MKAGSLKFVSINQNINSLRQQGFKAIQMSDWSDRVTPTFRQVDGKYDDVALWAINQGLSAERASQFIERHLGEKLSEFNKDRITRAIYARTSGTTLVDHLIQNFGYCQFVAMK